MFWKQNDTGIYGRRQEMFVDQLVKSPRVHKVVHFDNPITPGAIHTVRVGGEQASSLVLPVWDDPDHVLDEAHVEPPGADALRGQPARPALPIRNVPADS